MSLNSSLDETMLDRFVAVLTKAAKRGRVVLNGLFVTAPTPVLARRWFCGAPAPIPSRSPNFATGNRCRPASSRTTTPPACCD